MLTMPNVARCHASLGSISATATLKRVRRPSFTLRTTCRLSFSDCAPSMRISSVRCAIISASSLSGYTKSRKLAPRCEEHFPGLAAVSLCLGECYCRHLLDYIRLDDISRLDVTVVCDTDAALHAVAYFAGIVFKAPQRSDFAFEHHRVVAQESHIGVALDQ